MKFSGYACVEWRFSNKDPVFKEALAQGWDGKTALHVVCVTNDLVYGGYVPHE